MDKQTKELQKLIIAIIAWSMIVILILYKRKKLNIILNDIKNTWFMFSLVIVIAFTIYCWHSKDDHLKESSQKALVALLIAYLSRLDMVFAVYFIIFIFAFYTSGDIV
jgi:hypothetical protein